VNIRSPYDLAIKRLVDIVISLMALAALLPLLMVIALLVRWRLGSPIFFRQQRAGLRGSLFYITKFRTMGDDRDLTGNFLKDGDRLTRFGRFLRATSLDELPELWNVCRGDMSLVGPRPLLIEYLPLYTQEQQRRHDVRPGITGWAQVNGRNSISWEERFSLDVWYVDNRTFWLDVKILVLTGLQVFRHREISAAGQATMSRFTGSEVSKGL